MNLLLSLLIVTLTISCDSKKESGDLLQDAEIYMEGGDEISADDTADVSGEGDTVEQCEPVKQGEFKRPYEDIDKFALSIFHFNLQYVAGGLKGMFEGNPNFDLDEKQMEDRIIEQSFAPLIDILYDNPSWGANIEFQGYFLEVLLERFPAVVEKMRVLAARGQVEFMSFHFSDQLFLAYSKRSMEVSYEFTKDLFDRACLPLSPVVFTQEGQYGEGMIPFMLAHGYKTLVLPKNLYKYFHGEDDPVAPFYRLRGGEVVISRGFNDGEVEVVWHFVDDGELLLTNGVNPYLGIFFSFNEESKNKFIKEMQDLETKGFWVTTVSEYMKRVGEMGIKPAILRPTPDGTWQAGNSDNFFAWMGRAGLWGETERDNEVLTGNFRAEVLLKAAENCVKQGEKEGKIQSGSFDEDLKFAWRELLFAQVSDSTGWNPWAGEVNYSLSHNKNAVEKAKEILFACREAFDEEMLGVETLIDGTVIPCAVLQTFTGVMPEEVDPPVSVSIDNGGIDAEEKWYLMGEGKSGEKSYIARFKFIKKIASNAVSLSFPLWTDSLKYTPALIEDEIVAIPFGEFKNEKINLSLSNGLIGLGDGEFLVKVNEKMHLSVFADTKNKKVTFTDMTLVNSEQFEWIFLYLDNFEDKDALAIAKMFNISPMIVVSKDSISSPLDLLFEGVALSCMLPF